MCPLASDDDIWIVFGVARRVVQHLLCAGQKVVWRANATRRDGSLAWHFPSERVASHMVIRAGSQKLISKS